jgi:hypothetical protein
MNPIRGDFRAVRDGSKSAVLPRAEAWRGCYDQCVRSQSSSGGSHTTTKTSQLLRQIRARALIAERTKAALAQKKAQGAVLGNRTNLPDAQAKGVAANREAANAFTTNVLPIVRQIQAAGATTCGVE